ncbi:MAG: LacI family DNA-binding transcriptional regulator [Pacificimonas sp.]
MPRTAPGRVTSFDIAQAAGVSQPTVSRALRGSASVSAATRKRIEDIARELNYTVDKHASSLRLQRANTLALLFFEDPTEGDTLINPFFLSMLGSITRRTAQKGFDLLISFQQLSGDWHTDYEDSRKADGIILLGYGDYALYRPRLEQLRQQGTHFVRWGAPSASQDFRATIGTDNRAGGRMAAEHLIAHGRTRVAFVGDASDRYPEFRARYDGYVDALIAAGLAVDPELQVDAISLERSGESAAETLAARGASFDAIVAASDLIAIGVIRALKAAGIAVPDDVAVTGYDDIPAAAQAVPPLTTVQQDARLAGEVLVDSLLSRIEEKSFDRQLLPARLVVRGSCGQHTNT